ncbi:MAG: hypothetical protein ABI377_00730 [Devosia sp.]
MKLGEDVKAIWIASVPRTGSMWTFNIVRDLVRSTGRQVLPEIVPHEDEEMEAIGKAGIAASDDAAYVLKVHTAIDGDLEKSCFIVTQRDPHDSLVSFMRFTKCDFDHGLRFLASGIRLDRYYATFPANRTIVIAYPDIALRPAEVIHEIGRKLSIDVDPAFANTVIERYSKSHVQARLVERETVLKTKISGKQPVDIRDFVPSMDSSIRAFDTETGFQSGHVSDYKDGDWRRILTPAQQWAVEQLIEGVRSEPEAEARRRLNRLP